MAAWEGRHGPDPARTQKPRESPGFSSSAEVPLDEEEKQQEEKEYKGPGRAPAALGSRPPCRALALGSSHRTLQDQRRAGGTDPLRPLGRPLIASPTGTVLAPSTVLLRRHTSPCSARIFGRSGGPGPGLGGLGVGLGLMGSGSAHPFLILQASSSFCSGR